MKKIQWSISVIVLTVVLAGCKTMAAAFPDALNRNVLNLDGVRLEMTWCDVSKERVATCELKMVSQYQDKKAGLAYPKMQGDKGANYALKTDQAAGGTVMATGQTYTFKLTATNLPTYVTEVRSINSSFVTWTLNGIKSFEQAVVFSGIPKKPRSNTVFEKSETKYEVHGCTLSDTREFECDVSIANLNRDKTIHVNSIVFRDDTGNEYKAPNSPAYGNRLYYAGEVFRHKIRVANVSAQATAVTALVVGIDIRGGPSATYRGGLILSGMETRRIAASVSVTGTIECVSQGSAGDTTGLVNLALNRSATQSSTGRFTWDAVAGLANDGNKNGNYTGHSVAHTLLEQGPWWQVDLGKNQPLEKIVIWNRTDGGWGERLTDFQVTVTDESAQTVFTRRYCTNGATINPAMVVDLPEVVNGQFVKVSLNGSNYLQLAEVEVFGTAISKPPLAGCWNWSNGLRVVMTDEGAANSGFAAGSWIVTGDNRVTLSWPPLTGAIVLSGDGRSLSAVDSLGVRTTAQRIQGNPSGFAGVWQWSNGGVVNISTDGSMTVGHLRGSWTGAGKNYNIAWPLIDQIVIEPDGKSLSGSNQFGSFTASKQANCG